MQENENVPSLYSGSLVTVILAVNLAAGADYSAFVVFIPEFIGAGMLFCMALCLIYYARGDTDESDRINRDAGLCFSCVIMSYRHNTRFIVLCWLCPFSSQHS